MVFKKVLFWIFEILNLRLQGCFSEISHPPFTIWGNLKTAIIAKRYRKVNRSEIGGSGGGGGYGGGYSMYTGHFWHIADQAQSQDNRCVSNFRQLCISKMAGRRAKWTKFWASGVSIQCIQCIYGTFDSLVFKVSRGHAVHFRISVNLVSRRRLVVSCRRGK